MVSTEELNVPSLCRITTVCDLCRRMKRIVYQYGRYGITFVIGTERRKLGSRKSKERKRIVVAPVKVLFRLIGWKLSDFR